MGWERNKCVLRIVLKAKRMERLLFSNLTLQPNDTICTSFVNGMKVASGTGI